jgi:hypothetical protein
MNALRISFIGAVIFIGVVVLLKVMLWVAIFSALLATLIFAAGVMAVIWFLNKILPKG